MPKLIAIAAAGATLLACGGTVMTCPRVETPVLLGPVDRIGGAPHPAPEDGPVLLVTAEHKVFSERVWQTPSSYWLYTYTHRTLPWVGSTAIWSADLADADDVRVTAVRARFDWNGMGMTDNRIDTTMVVAKGK